MTDPTSHALPADDDETRATSGRRRLVATIAFVGVVVLIIALFSWLSSLDRAPTMPAAGAMHHLVLNAKGELIGVESDPGAHDAILAPGVHVDVHAVERRINESCQACHGAPNVDLSQHPCQQGAPCVDAHHPPKTECIKCHRMPAR